MGSTSGRGGVFFNTFDVLYFILLFLVLMQDVYRYLTFL